MNTFKFSTKTYGRSEILREKAPIPPSFCFNINLNDFNLLDSPLPQCISCNSFISEYSNIDKYTKKWKCNFCSTISENPLINENIITNSKWILKEKSTQKTIFFIDGSSSGRNSNLFSYLLDNLIETLGNNVKNVAFAIITKKLSILMPKGHVMTFCDLDSAIIPPNCFFNSPLPSLKPLLDIKHDSEGPDIFSALKIGYNSVGKIGRIILCFSYFSINNTQFKRYNIENENTCLRGINFNEEVQNICDLYSSKGIRADFLICSNNNKLLDLSTFSKFSSNLGGVIEYISQQQFIYFKQILFKFINNLTCENIIKSNKFINILPSLSISTKKSSIFLLNLNSNIIFPFQFNLKTLEEVYFQSLSYIHQFNGDIIVTVSTYLLNFTDDLSLIYKNIDYSILLKYISSSLISLFFTMNQSLSKMLEPSLGILKPIFQGYIYNVSISPTRFTNLVMPSSLNQLPKCIIGLLKSPIFVPGISFDERSFLLFLLSEINPEKLIHFSNPLLFNITKYIKNGEEVESKKLSESSLSNKDIFLLDMEFFSWLWIGSQIEKELCIKTFGKSTPIIIEQILPLGTIESNRLFSLLKGNFRFIIENKFGEQLFRDRMIEDGINNLPSYLMFLSNLHKLTLK